MVADEALFIGSGILFHKRFPQNFIESMPKIMLFAAGICNKSFVLRSYLVSFLTKHSFMNDGLVQLSVLYISIISTRRFWMWMVVSLFFESKTSNVDSWSSSSIKFQSLKEKGIGERRSKRRKSFCSLSFSSFSSSLLHIFLLSSFLSPPQILIVHSSLLLRSYCVSPCLNRRRCITSGFSLF